MKMYKKSDLTLNHGMLVSKDGDIVLPDPLIVGQANQLETLVQKAAYLMAQPEATPMPSLDGFERKSIKDSDSRKFKVTTPTIDSKVDEAMRIMDELDDAKVADKANSMLDDFGSFVDFVTQDFVVDCGSQLCLFDTPMMGDVLKLTEADVVNAIAYVCGMTEDDDKAVKERRIYASEMSDEEVDALLGILANHDEDVAKVVANAVAEDEADEE